MVIQKILTFCGLFAFTYAHASLAGTEKIYVGCYSCCFESNIFFPIPNQNGEGWEVVRKPYNFLAAIKKFPAHQEEIEPIYFLRVKGKLGNRGQFGHLGLASREMEITKVSEIREFKKSNGVCNIPQPPEILPYDPAGLKAEN